MNVFHSFTIFNFYRSCLPSLSFVSRIAMAMYITSEMERSVEHSHSNYRDVFKSWEVALAGRVVSFSS